MPTPALVPTEIDAIAAPPGRDFISLLSLAKFASEADRLAFVAYLALTGLGMLTISGLTPQSVPTGETLTVPDGYDLLVAPGFVIDGTLDLAGSSRLYVLT